MVWHLLCVRAIEGHLREDETWSMFCSGRLWRSQGNWCKLSLPISTGWSIKKILTGWFSLSPYFIVSPQGSPSSSESCPWEEEDRLHWAPFPSQQVFTSARPKTISRALAPERGWGWAGQKPDRGKDWASDNWRGCWTFLTTRATPCHWSLENIRGWK